MSYPKFDWVFRGEVPLMRRRSERVFKTKDDDDGFIDPYKENRKPPG